MKTTKTKPTGTALAAAQAAEAALWARLLTAKAARDHRGYALARAEIAGLYELLPGRLAERVWYRLRRRDVDAGDLASDGFFGLIDAIDRFEPGRGLKFPTFAQQRIKGAIFDALRNRMASSRLGMNRDGKLRRWLERLEQAAGRPVGLAEAAAISGVPVRDVVGWAEDVRLGTALDRATSTAAMLSGHEDRTVNDLLIGREVDPAEAVARQDAADQILRLLPAGPFRKIVRWYHLDGWKMREIGQKLQMSESRVSQLHDQAMTMLRRAARDAGLGGPSP